MGKSNISGRYTTERVSAGVSDEVSNNLSQLSESSLAWLAAQQISRELRRKVEKRLRKIRQ